MEKDEKFATQLPTRISKLGRVGSRGTDERVNALRRQGRKVLKLSAYPDRALPSEVLEQARIELESRCHAPPQGLAGLREAVAAYWEDESGKTIDAEKEVLITCGAMHALSIILSTILDPGDEVLLFTPSYFYEGIVTLAGGNLRPIPLREEDDFCWRPKLLRDAIGPRTRAILLNTPTNPTGAVADKETFEEIADLAQQQGLFVVCDESYDRLVYDGKRHVSVLTGSRNRDRTILVASFTKSFCLAAWRVGYLVASPAIIQAAQKILEWNMLFCPYINQRVAELVLRSDRRWLDGIRAEFEVNRNRMISIIRSCRELSVVTPQGNPFVFVNFERLGKSDEEISSLLLERYGLPCTPGHLHGAQGYVRIPFGGKIETAEEGGRAVVQAVNEMPKLHERLPIHHE